MQLNKNFKIWFKWDFFEGNFIERTLTFLHITSNSVIWSHLKCLPAPSVDYRTFTSVLSILICEISALKRTFSEEKY